MEAAKAKAAKEAEDKLAAEMAAAEKAAEESAARDREKHEQELARAGGTAAAAAESQGYQPAEVSKGGRRKSVAAGGAYAAAPDVAEAAAAKAAAVAKAEQTGSGEGKEEIFDVTLKREQPRESLGIAVDLWDGMVTVGSIPTNGLADKEGSLVQGDIIRAVDGKECSSIEEVTMCVIKSGMTVKLQVARRPVTTILETEMKMKMPDGKWEPFSFRLLSKRNIEFEKLSPPQYSGIIHARVAQALDLRSEGKLVENKVLAIETGHKTFELKANSAKELTQWHLRLQEIIMLQEKVANVAHGWLLKEEKKDGKTELKNYWFVLFSNGILMQFADPKTANLGQALGFIPVETCEKKSVSAKQDTLTIKCKFDQWLLATNTKDSLAQWGNSLRSAQPGASQAKQAQDLLLEQNWVEMPKDEHDEDSYAMHWYQVRTLFTTIPRSTAPLSSPPPHSLTPFISFFSRDISCSTRRCASTLRRPRRRTRSVRQPNRSRCS